MAPCVRLESGCNCAKLTVCVSQWLMCEIRTDFGLEQQTFPLLRPGMLRTASTPLNSLLPSFPWVVGVGPEWPLIESVWAAERPGISWFLSPSSSSIFLREVPWEGRMAVDQAQYKVRWGFIFVLFVPWCTCACFHKHTNRVARPEDMSVFSNFLGNAGLIWLYLLNSY